MKNKDLLAVIVEDCEHSQSLIRLSLNAIGIKNILKVVDGIEATSLLRNIKADVIMMDWNMPGMDGIQCTEKLRGEAGLNQNTPIIMLTSNDSDEQERAAYRSGVTYYLKKPFSLRTITRGIEMILSMQSKKIKKD
jgi:two-component system, chemotaxis family, chemotaxis protein CheY